jgi:hypothetical protein
MKKLVAGLMIIGCMVGSIWAQDTWPVDLSFMDWVHRPADVAGLRVGIPYGSNDSITGLDVGLWGRSDYAWAIQVNVLHNKVRDEMGGCQVSLLNDAGHLAGVQIGLWNQAPSMDGMQIGLLNLADEAEGFQIGIVNRTELMHGYQIGLFNIIRESTVPFVPFVNFML